MAATAVSETTALLNQGTTDSLERVLSNASHHPRYDTLRRRSSAAKADVVDLGDFDTTYKYESRLLATYSSPLIVTYLLQYSYNLVTIFVAGRLGTIELGAASLASMTAEVTGLCVYEGLATALDTLTSQAYGGGKRKLVGLHVQRMMALMVVVSIPIGLIWITSPWTLVKLVPEKETARLAGRYLQIYLIGAPAYGIFEASKRFTQAQGYFMASLIPMLICAPLNILWNWLFVFKFNLGFEGAALAVALSLNLQPIVYLLYIVLFARGSLECWPGFGVKRTFQNWGAMIKLGIPGILMVLSEWLAFDILTFASSYLGAEVLAAESVLMTVAVTMYHIPMPVSIAASTRFGNLIGRGALTAARKAMRLYILIFVFIGVFDLMMLNSLRHVIAKLFTNDEAVRKIVVQTIPLVAAAQVFDAQAAIVNSLLRGLGRQNIGGWVNLGVYYLWAVPLAIFLSFGPAKLGLLGLWIGPLSGLVIVFLIVSLYLKRSDWQKAVEEAREREE